MSVGNHLKKATVAVATALTAAIAAKNKLESLSDRISNLKKLDERGALYYFDYKGDYDDLFTKFPIKLLRKCGCSAFCCQNDKNEIVTGRNYDLAHTDKDKNITGLNVVFRLHSQGKYSSINIADACWFSILKLPYYLGAFENEKTTRLPLYLLPYFCMDGINEKGLTVSILYLDIKEGEKAVDQKVKGKKTIILTQLIRYMLDQCATLQQAIDLAKNYNITNTLHSDYHLFVSDENGASAVFEWRHNTLKVIKTDAVTNFYVGDDDARDCYYGTTLKERFVMPEQTVKEYHYGYGHGYDRFNKMTTCLQQNIVDKEKLISQLTNQQAMSLLQEVAQEYDQSDISSHTQYSALYNNTDRSVDICVFRDYSKIYHFEI